MKKKFTRENDIVVDHEHGLMWQDDDSVNNRIDWNQANAMASQLRLGNYNDWRLPSSDELLSIANKNNVPQLDNIFINRPFSTWSALESENKLTARTIFYHDKDIVSSIHSSDDRKDSKLFVRYVRDIEKINNRDYETDINNLTCTCKNWKLLRSQFPIDDPRRLCKHLIKKIDIDNMDSNLNRYKYEIKFYKNKNSGFPDDFNTLIDIEGTSHKLLYKHDHQSWMSFFDSDGTKYGVMHENYEKVVWTHLYGKPHDYAKVEKYFNQLTVKLPLWLQEYEENELIHYMKTVIPGKENSHFSIELHQYVPTPSEIYYLVGEDNDNIRNIIDNEIDMIVVKKDIMIIEMYGAKKYHIARDCEKVKFSIEKMEQEEQERLNKEREKYEQKLSEKKAKVEQKGYLFLVKDYLYLEAITISNRDHDAPYTEYLDASQKISLEYMSTQQLLESSKIDLTLHLFNNILKKMKVIKKEKGLNLDDWIIVNDGLKFGINLEKSSQYFSKTIPDWYQIKRMHPITFQLIDLEDRENVRMTNIRWKKDKFPELLQLVIQHIENSSNASKIVVKSSRQTERDEWLQFVECPNCASKNIHKKNKRTYGYGEVQRYQCIDCKKIFQELINKKSNDDVTE